MKLLEKYLFREWAKAFAAALGVTLGILLMEDMYREFQDLLKNGAPMLKIFAYYLLLIPGFFPMLIPVAIFLATLFTFGKFNRNNEIVAMKISGLNFWQFTRFLWLIGLVCSMILLGLTAIVIPKIQVFVEHFRLILSAKNPASSAGINQLHRVTYSNSSAGRIWIIETLNRLENCAVGVHIYQYSIHGSNRKKISAESGFYDGDHWILSAGEESFFDPNDGELSSQKKFDRKEFCELRESPREMVIMQKRPKDLSLADLKIALHSLPPYFSLHRVYSIRYHAMLAGCWSALVAVFCAVPFSFTGVRRSPLVSTSQACGLLFLFYLLANLGFVFGSHGQMPPILAAWLPNMLVLLLSGIKIYRLD